MCENNGVVVIEKDNTVIPLTLDEEGRVRIKDISYVDYLSVERFGGSKILRVSELCKRVGWERGDSIKVIALKSGMVILVKTRKISSTQRQGTSNR